MKTKNKCRKIQQEYMNLRNFEGYYGKDGFRLWFDYDDPYAGQCFGAKSYCSDFLICIKYAADGSIEEIHVSYYDGDMICTLCPYWYFSQSELQEFTELPICLGFDERNCDKRWNNILRHRS